MLAKFIEERIKTHFEFESTAQQNILISILGEYVANPDNHNILIINGYAGTGKTTIMSAFANTLKEFKIPYFLLAPTGRAAKVLAYNSRCEALTIHKKIYRQKSATQESFVLDFNKSHNAFYIIDEASMISASSSFDNNIFGSGNLLEDLTTYVSNGDGGRIIMIGDKAQLPPVGSDLSPALDDVRMSQYGNVKYVEINEVMRQSNSSGILFNATICRRLVEGGEAMIPRFNISYPDFKRINGGEFIETLEDMYGKWGQNNCVVITRSNKQANRFNKAIRSMVMFQEEEIDSSDMLMIVKNNYFYSLKEEEDASLDSDFIANGDVAIVRRIRKYTELYGFRFVDATLRFPDSDDMELECKLMLDTLMVDTPSLGYEESKRLFAEVEADYGHVKTKRERYKKIKEDPYFNALQVKFAYAITCHKAQGGQWDAVFIDRLLWGQEYMSIDMLRWLYTAITRAKKQIYLLNFGDEFFDE